MTFKGVEDFDDLDTESIYWVAVSGVPERFVNEAKRIDGAEYSGECFGICIQHNLETGEFSVVEGSPGHGLYYVDNLGYSLCPCTKGIETCSVLAVIFAFCITAECSGQSNHE